MKTLIAERGANGLFVDYRELLKKLQHTYAQRGDGSESDILAPVLAAEVLVLDELGASKPTEWVMDTVGYVLNSRYNSCRTTIVTTNYANRPATVSQPGKADSNTSSGRFAGRDTRGPYRGEDSAHDFKRCVFRWRCRASTFARVFNGRGLRAQGSLGAPVKGPLGRLLLRCHHCWCWKAFRAPRRSPLVAKAALQNKVRDDAGRGRSLHQTSKSYANAVAQTCRQWRSNCNSVLQHGD